MLYLYIRQMDLKTIHVTKCLFKQCYFIFFINLFFFRSSLLFSLYPLFFSIYSVQSNISHSIVLFLICLTISQSVLFYSIPFCFIQLTSGMVKFTILLKYLYSPKSILSRGFLFNKPNNKSVSCCEVPAGILSIRMAGASTHNKHTILTTKVRDS